MKKQCLFILFALFLSACSSSPEDAFMQDYLERISRVSDHSFQPISTDLFPVIPTLHQRHYVISNAHMKAVMALDLLQCPKLSQKVAYRNSSLGKQMPPSQRLHYEKELLIELDDCIDYLQSTESEPE